MQAIRFFIILTTRHKFQTFLFGKAIRDSVPICESRYSEHFPKETQRLVLYRNISDDKPSFPGQSYLRRSSRILGAFINRSANFGARVPIILFLTWIFISGSLRSEANPLQETQAENLLRIAEEAYKDRKFHKSIEEIKNFLILFPSSKFKNKAYQILKNNYSRLGRPEKVLEINLHQYSQEPTSSLGLNAFFEAGKLYLEIGEENKAIEVFKSICTQSFSRELAEKASSELSEWEILNDSKTEMSECGEK